MIEVIISHYFFLISSPKMLVAFWLHTYWYLVAVTGNVQMNIDPC